MFQATTATNTSTISIFENPYYFEFEPSASQVSSVATSANFAGQSLSIWEIFWLFGKNIGENVNNDSVIGAISATRVL